MSSDYQTIAKTAIYVSKGDVDDAIITTALALGSLIAFRKYEDKETQLPQVVKLAFETVDEVIRLLEGAPEQVIEALKKEKPN